MAKKRANIVLACTYVYRWDPKPPHPKLVDRGMWAWPESGMGSATYSLVSAPTGTIQKDIVYQGTTERGFYLFQESPTGTWWWFQIDPTTEPDRTLTWEVYMGSTIDAPTFAGYAQLLERGHAGPGRLRPGSEPGNGSQA